MKGIYDNLQLCKDWQNYKELSFIIFLSIADELKDLIDESELKPLYGINLLDFFNPKEPTTSEILENILSYQDNNGYVLLNSFCETFLSSCGFDSRQISDPDILSEKKGRMDLRITEEERYAIIFENKLKGADFQRNQIARYIQTILSEGFSIEQIFIVILPLYDNVYIRPSVWRLPCDYNKTSNSERKCGIIDDKQCWCDVPHRNFTKSELSHCDKCEKDWKNIFNPHTVIITRDLSEWLIESEKLIPKRELNIRSAILQFADYLNGLYNNRIDQKLNKMITQFLREKLELDTSIASWRKLNNRINEVNELVNGLESLRLEMSSDLIDSWYETLREKWPMLRTKPRKSFGILIKGMWFGCWNAEESDNGDSPIWGVFCNDGNPSALQMKVANKILSLAGLSNSVEENQWLTWDNTIHGDKIADKIYTVAKELGYLKV